MPGGPRGLPADPRHLPPPHVIMSAHMVVPPGHPLGLAQATHARYTCDPAALREADFIVVAVPTPVDEARIPDFGPLLGACRTIGPNLKPGAVVVFESTVYPGATEEICIPELERVSGLVWQRDFFVGYSPERINPGDREHRLTNVIKVVAGDSPATLEKVAALYLTVVEPGVMNFVGRPSFVASVLTKRSESALVNDEGFLSSANRSGLFHTGSPSLRQKIESAHRGNCSPGYHLPWPKCRKPPSPYSARSFWTSALA